MMIKLSNPVCVLAILPWELSAAMAMHIQLIRWNPEMSFQANIVVVVAIGAMTWEYSGHSCLLSRLAWEYPGHSCLLIRQ